MTTYQFYVVYNDERVLSFPFHYDCADDDAAIREAARIVKGRPVEIWKGTLKVAVVRPRPRRVA